MKICITGVTGFVGKALARELIKDGHDLMAIVRPSSDLTFSKDNNIKYFVDDGAISNLIDCMGGEKCEGIIHLASLYLKDHQSDDIAALIESNVLFSTRLAEAASKSANMKWFINTGTFWQHYQNTDFSPVNLYAATKQAFEDILVYYQATTAMQFVTIKLNDTYGPGDTRSKIINIWKRMAQTGEVMNMSGGEQIIDMIYIDDLVSAYMQLISLLSQKNKTITLEKSYVVSSHERMTLKQLAQTFEAVSQKKLLIKWGALPYRPREVMKPYDQGIAVPGWQPKVSFKQGIANVFRE